MIEIFEAKNPKIIPYITDKFPEIEGLDVRDGIEQLLMQLASDPEHTSIFVVFEEEELKAFIYGFIHDSNKYAWVEQAWAETELQKEYKQEVFDKFIDWVKEFGVQEVRAQTKRMNMKAWEKLYGFKEQAVIIQREI